MKDEALKLAQEALGEIALAGMSGSGQESEEAMTEWHARQAWKFVGIAARALDSIKQATARPAPVQDDPDEQVIRERDEAEAIADALAEKIAAITGCEIGEHTSANSPWHNALDAADEFLARRPPAPAQPAVPMTVAQKGAIHAATASMRFYVAVEFAIRKTEAHHGITAAPAHPPVPPREHDHVLEQALTRLQKRYAELEAKVAARPEPIHQGYVPISDDLKSVFIEGAGEIQLAWPSAQPAPVQEPVAWRVRYHYGTDGMAKRIGAWRLHSYSPTPEEDKEIEPLYTAPTHPPVPLTDDEVNAIMAYDYATATVHGRAGYIAGFRAAEAAHGITAEPEKGKP